MKKLLFPIALSLFSSAAMADDYSFWTINTKQTKLSFARSYQALLSEMSVNNSLPCIVAADVNATGVKCGPLYFVDGGFYTNTISNQLPSLKLPKALKSGYKQTHVANFRSPKPGVFGQSVGHQSMIRSDIPLSEIHFQVSSGQTLAPASDTLYVMVNGIEKSFDLIPGQVNFISVDDPKGFSNVLIRSTGQSDAFIADYFGYTKK
jgi:hypothetical protein